MCDNELISYSAEGILVRDVVCIERYKLPFRKTFQPLFLGFITILIIIIVIFNQGGLTLAEAFVTFVSFKGLSQIVFMSTFSFLSKELFVNHLVV